MPDQLVRIHRTESALRGFEPQRDARKRSFLECIGEDGRVRPFFGIYRSQSSRSQPSATGFLFLKSAWIRCLVQPHPDNYIGSIDYSAQEFLIAACLSGDRAMMDDYASGDPYVSFGIRAGIIPKGGTKKTHKIERETCKSLILGTLFGLGGAGMGKKITTDTDVYCSEEQAREYINLFRQTYPDYIYWRREIAQQYERDGYLRLVDGWTMWGDNDNPLSTQNMPVQGTGAVVMRRAVSLAQDYNVKVIKTLHDALYNEDRWDDGEGLDVLGTMASAMQVAWHEVMAACGCPQAPDIRMEAFAWGPRLPERKGLFLAGGTPLETAPIYIDDRAVEEYALYAKYLTPEVDIDWTW